VREQALLKFVSLLLLPHFAAAIRARRRITGLDSSSL